MKECQNNRKENTYIFENCRNKKLTASSTSSSNDEKSIQGAAKDVEKIDNFISRQVLNEAARDKLIEDIDNCWKTIKAIEETIMNTEAILEKKFHVSVD